ncbi:MAG: ComF family protein [Traorella sp.]
MKLCKICFHPIDEGLTLREYLFEDDVICGNCRHRLIKNDRIYSYKNLRIQAFYIYNDFLESLLFQYKEGRDIALKDIFLWKNKDKMNELFRQTTCVIMPSSIEKIQERGFHHLKEMLSICDIQIQECFIKNKNIKQSSQRAKNREKIHEIIELQTPPNKPYYLFDDVITSGNTLLSASEKIASENEIIQVIALSVHPHFVELCDKEKL